MVLIYSFLGLILLLLPLTAVSFTNSVNNKDTCYHLNQLLSSHLDGDPFIGSNYRVKRVKRSTAPPASVSSSSPSLSSSPSYQLDIGDYPKKENTVLYNGNSIEADIKHLRHNLVNNFASVRNTFANDSLKQTVRKTIIDKFVKLRLETWTHKFNATEMRFLNLPVIEGMNIIAILPGSSRDTDQESLILIGAHYDTVLLSPGVNDNGSGMSALLEIARLLTTNRCHLQSTVIFVAFDLEEYGGLGSRHLVHEYLIPIHLAGKRSKFRGAFILDTLLNFDDTVNSQDIPADIQRVIPFWGKNGSNDNMRGDFIATFTRKAIDSRLSSTLARHWRERQGSTNFNMVNVEIATLPSEMPNVKILSDHVNFLRSDHVMFWYHNSSLHKPTLKAIFLTDTGPFRGYMRKCYHETCDDLSLVTDTNLKFLKLIVEVLTTTILDIGDGRCKVSPKGLSKFDVRQSNGSQVIESSYTIALVTLIILTIGLFD